MNMENYQKAQRLISDAAAIERFYSEWIEGIINNWKSRAPINDVCDCRNDVEFVVTYLKTAKKAAIEKADKEFEEI